LTAALDTGTVRQLARACGFELAGVAAAVPSADRACYHEWVAAGYAGEMRYLTDRRAGVRDDPRNLLASARSMICVGKLYHTPWPYSTQWNDRERAWISRYAWGGDYHDVVRQGLEQLDNGLRRRTGPGYESKICVDTAPLLERSYARMAGLGWIGKNTCLINQPLGSWYFLGELLVSLEIEPDRPPPDRCGTCTRCIDACPTAAIVPGGRDPLGGDFAIDSSLCISYFTIELRGSIPEAQRGGIGSHVFGCDICQDVCPWNLRAPVTDEPAFAPHDFAPPLERLAAMTELEFRSMFHATPVTRARYAGFLRNVAVAMGNAGLAKFRQPLQRLAESPDPAVAEHARWALQKLPPCGAGCQPAADC
jgi:epoxyqueuosine reductase